MVDHVAMYSFCICLYKINCQKLWNTCGTPKHILKHKHNCCNLDGERKRAWKGFGLGVGGHPKTFGPPGKQSMGARK